MASVDEAEAVGGRTGAALPTAPAGTRRPWLPLAVSVESAKPHDVQAARRILKQQLDPKHPALPGLRAIVTDRGYRGLETLADSLGLNLDIKIPPAPPVLPPKKPGGKPRRGKRVFTPLRPLYKVENAFARLGMWRRLSRCYEQTALGAQTWMEVGLRRLPLREVAGRADLMALDHGL